MWQGGDTVRAGGGFPDSGMGRRIGGGLLKGNRGCLLGRWRSLVRMTKYREEVALSE
jgi:hypothetical protein